jgi:hypothetical protein
MYVDSITKKTKLRGRSPQANYTDRATAACRRSRQPLRVEGVAWSAQRIPMAVILGFVDRNRYFFIQVAPQLYVVLHSHLKPTASGEILTPIPGMFITKEMN